VKVSTTKKSVSDRPSLQAIGNRRRFGNAPQQLPDVHLCPGSRNQSLTGFDDFVEAFPG